MPEKYRNYIKNGLFFTCSLVVLAFVAIFIINLNRFSGLTGDDFLYHFIYTGEWPAKTGAQPYQNLWDFLQGIYNHMTLWNARLTSIIFEIAAMQIPKTAFNIINTIAFLLVGIEINILAAGKKALTQPFKLLITYLLMWFFLSGFGSTVLWVSGAANYLWTTVIILAFFMPYRFNYELKRHTDGIAWLIFLLALFAGMSNEVGSSTAIIVVAGFTYANRPAENANDMWWKILGVFTNTAAFVTMIYLSSNSTESVAYGEKDGLIYHASKIISNTISYSGPLLLAIILLSLVVIFNQRHLFRNILSTAALSQLEQTTFTGIIFFIAGLAGVGAMLISPVLFARLWFAVNILLLVSLMSFFEAYQLIRQGNLFTNLLVLAAAATLLVLFLPSYRTHLINLQESYDVFSTHEKLAVAAHNRGDKVVHLPGMKVTTDPYNPYNGTPYIMPGKPKKQWSNTWMAAFWGLDEVVLDNSVPVQKSGQQNLYPIDQILAFDEKKIGKNDFLKQFKLPQLTEQQTHVVGVKNDPNMQSLPAKIDNSNLPADKPWLRNALITYVDVTTNKVVGTEQITSPNFNAYNISNASIPGYDTLPDNPKSYMFTDSYNQIIKLRVEPLTRNINLYFQHVEYDGAKKQIVPVTTANVTAKIGQLVTLAAPTGYTFASGKDRMTLKVTGSTAEVQIYLKTLPWNKRIMSYKGYILLGKILLAWVILDIVVSVTVRKIADWRERRKKKKNST